jgi:SNF2 family DNA or RNA helicase
MPATDTPPLRDYQDTGASWLRDQLKDHRAVLLADEMGLGKTRQALTAAQHLGADRVLIVCPAGARRVWLREIQRWTPSWQDRVVLIEPGTTVPLPARLNNPAPLILIVGYDELSNRKSPVLAQLQRRSWQLLVIDEAHYLKNPSNRTQALYGVRGSAEGIQANCSRIILLTGTPTPNHAGELWQHCRALWPWSLEHGPQRRLLTEAGFEDLFTRYRDTVYGRQITGSKNQDILRAKLAEVVLRRRKDEVLAELPPLIVQDIPLVSTGSAKFSDDARGMMRRLDWSLKGVTDDRVLRLLRAPDTGTATLRRELGEAKVPATLAWVQERMASVDKLVLFAWHHSVIEQLARGLAEFDPQVITGFTSSVARIAAIDRFQDHPGPCVFIGQILAAGTAISLTAAQEIAIVEPSWVPGENVQAIARAHRLGQHDSVLASFLFLPGTLDQRIIQVFRRKASEISVLQGDDANGADADQHEFRPGNRVGAD